MHGTRVVPVSFPKPGSAVLALLLAGAAMATGLHAATRSGGNEPTVDPDGYTSSRVCGECHADIYESWKNSLHAFSLTDPIFDTAYMQAVKEAGDEARRVCLRCHAPMTMVNADLELRQGVTREGVSCDFCHTVTEVFLDGRDRPYASSPGLVKRGVIEKTDSPAHQVAYSELHTKSEFCGGCHNYVTPGGKPIMSTYDEWRAGPYAREGVQCQDCHMVRSRGSVVRPEIRASRGEIHLHDLIHDTDQLRSALTLRIVDTRRSARSLEIDVEIENVGSGHMVPTGIPTREVLLRVEVESAGRTLRQERSYRKVVADERGRPLKRDYEVLLYGARILNDNRIAPREKRGERFTFDVPLSARTVKVAAELSYRYATVILREQHLNVELARVERFVQ